jgi:ABC-2 type transport system permease protein
MPEARQSVSLLSQIRLVAGLRWRLLRNKMRKESNVMDAIGVGFAGVFGAILILALCFAFFAGGEAFVAGGHATRLRLLFWALFLWWQVFPFFVAGFGATFEFRTLLRFPLSPRAFYLIGLAYGFADFAAIAGVCWLLAMTAGVSVARPALLPVMLLVSAIFVLLNVTLERLIGSWLERILSRRRTREIFFALFVLAMVSVQLINPLLRRYGSSAMPLLERWSPYLAPFPGSLAGSAVADLARGAAADSVAAIAGLLLYVAIFSAMLWRRFAAQYRGEELNETAAPGPLVLPRRHAAGNSSDGLGFLSPSVSEVLRKEFHYLLRNGFSFVLLILPPFIIFVFTMQGVGTPHSSNLPFAVSRSAFFPAIMGYLILVLMSPAYNCFAYEGRGIQTYYMAPMRFRQVFLGKNLLMAVVLALEMAAATVVFSLRVGLPSTPVVTATLAAVVFTTVGQFAIANWSSLTFPRKLNFGQMRGQRQSGMAVLVAFAVQIMLGAVSAVLLWSGRWTGNVWLPTEAFVFLAAAAVAGYVASLDPLSDYAERKKETLIETLCR